MNNFIVSGKGFLKSIEFNKDEKRIYIEWTQVLRDAQRYHSKQAVNLINKHKIEGFVWNPYKEEPVRGKWEVTQRREHYSFIHDESHKALEWRPEKVIMKSKTDVNFLTSKGVDRNVYYNSYEDALEICQERNRQIILELEEKMQKMVKA